VLRWLIIRTSPGYPTPFGENLFSGSGLREIRTQATPVAFFVFSAANHLVVYAVENKKIRIICDRFSFGRIKQPLHSCLGGWVSTCVPPASQTRTRDNSGYVLHPNLVYLFFLSWGGSRLSVTTFSSQIFCVFNDLGKHLHFASECLSPKMVIIYNVFAFFFSFILCSKTLLPKRQRPQFAKKLDTQGAPPFVEGTTPRLCLINLFLINQQSWRYANILHAFSAI